MAYCPDCGDELHNCALTVSEPDPEAEAARAEVKATKVMSSAEVEIARIQAEAQVEIARLQAGIVKDEVVLDAVVAEAEAEAVTDALAPPEPEPQPIMIQDASETEGSPTDLPEPEDHTEPHEPKKRGLGAWG